jgi:uncharacterized membrane protein YoaK (UPF0700 family)
MASRTARGASDEETPLLGSVAAKNSGPSYLRRHLKQDVSRNWADAVLLFGYIITGVLDSSAVFIWGSFVSMQTGNTVYLGLGLVAPHEGIRYLKALTSIVSFCIGSFAFARFHRFFSPKKRWVLIASYGIQLLFILFAALIVTLGTHVRENLHWQVLLPLAAVAFQSSGQAVTSRALQFNGLTSVVLTSNYCDLFSDPKLFAWDNVERNRRIGAPVLLLFGACIGGLWAHSGVGLAGALWTAVGLKLCIVVAWLFWTGEEEE